MARRPGEQDTSNSTRLPMTPWWLLQNVPGWIMLKIALRLDNTLIFGIYNVIYVEGAQDDVDQRCSRLW